MLKQRVQLQREVITKASNLSDELRGREKEKRIKVCLNVCYVHSYESQCLQNCRKFSRGRKLVRRQ